MFSYILALLQEFGEEAVASKIRTVLDVIVVRKTPLFSPSAAAAAAESLLIRPPLHHWHWYHSSRQQQQQTAALSYVCPEPVSAK